jgi:hypothetical protein
MKLRSVLTALILCLLAIPAMAEDTTNLDDLMIPVNLGPKGRAGLAKFYGRPLVVEDGKWKGILHFEANGRVAWTRHNGKTKHGHFGDSAYEDRMCFDFGYDFSDCFWVQQQGNDFNFQPEDGGPVYVGHAEQGEAEAELPSRDPQICEGVDAILDAGAKDKLVDLTDPNKDEIRVNDFSEPSFWTTVQMGNDFCRYDEGGLRPSVDCEFFFADDAPEAEKLYEAFVGQVRVCAADQIKKSEIDPEVWLKYAEIDFAKKGTKKIDKKDFTRSKLDPERVSNFVFDGKMESRITLGYRSICKDIVDCKYYYGVWASFAKPL